MSGPGAKHFAVLFALLGREAARAAGLARGQELCARLARLAGEQRGQAMAARARAAGQAPDWAAWFLWQDWRFAPGEYKRRLGLDKRDLFAHVGACPFNQAWRMTGLTEFGRAWCANAYAGELAGFNPGLKLEVLDALTVGAAKTCHLALRGANLGRLKRLGLWRARRRLAPRAVEPWGFHLGRLWSLGEQVLTEALGGRAAQRALDAAAAEFAERYGPEAAGFLAREDVGTSL